MGKKRLKSADPLRDLPHYIRVFQSYIGMRMYVVFALVMAATLAEGVGILMLLPLLGTLDVGFSGVTDTRVGVAMQALVNFFGVGDSLLGALLLLFAFFVLKGSFLFFANAYKAYLNADLQRQLKIQMLHGFNRMRLAYYVSRDTGYFINVINTQVSLFLQAFVALITLGAQLVNVVVYMILAILVAWRFGLMALAIGIPVLFAFRFLNTWVRQVSRKNSAENGVLSKLLIQSLQSLKYLTATAKNAHLERGAIASINRLRRYSIQMGVAGAFTKSVQEPIVVGAVLVVVGIQLAWLGQPLGPIIVSIILFNRGLNALLGLQGSWQNAVGKLGGVEMVRDEFANLTRAREIDGNAVLGPFAKQIELRNVSFSYGEENEDVLKDISLTIPARTSIALVGESGAGKSTLVDLLTLMLEPRSGEILIDGVSGRDAQRATWRDQIGFVSQETVVFDDTVANNISLWEGDPNQDPELMDRIRVAARQAHIAHFIESLPEGYNTFVGDRGVRLSGGQRQRLFIARELFKKPNVLILDEATSALDSESERAIQESIDKLKRQITVVIIAHRLSTIRNVDRVYVFDRGRLVEEGGYEDLRDADDSRFGKLVAMQAL